jgi:hypothetical protein
MVEVNSCRIHISKNRKIRCVGKTIIKTDSKISCKDLLGSSLSFCLQLFENRTVVICDKEEALSLGNDLKSNKRIRCALIRFNINRLIIDDWKRHFEAQTQ